MSLLPYTCKLYDTPRKIREVSIYPVVKLLCKNNRRIPLLSTPICVWSLSSLNNNMRSGYHASLFKRSAVSTYDVATSCLTLPFYLLGELYSYHITVASLLFVLTLLISVVLLGSDYPWARCSYMGAVVLKQRSYAGWEEGGTPTQITPIFLNIKVRKYLKYFFNRILLKVSKFSYVYIEETGN